MPARIRQLLPVAAVACALAAGASPAAAAPARTGQFPGPVTAPGTPPPMTIVNGRARAPRGAPRAVRRVITAANRLVRKPYKWGGGHRAFARKLARGYDCSGAVSYALFGARALTWPLDSTGLMKWGRRGAGRWITVYANKEHTYMVVAGTRFDTSLHDYGTPGPKTGPRWSIMPRPRKGFRARHPLGL